MSLPTKRNLGSLRQELRDRLGFASSGSQSGPNASIMDSFLRSAQEFLYWEYTPREMIETVSIVSQDAQTAYTWPDTVHLDRIITVIGEDTSSATPNRWEMLEGIEYNHDNYVTPKTTPTRYEVRSSFEVWPQPDGNQYKFYIEHVKRLNAFSVDADFVTLDADMVLHLAIANSKSHYRHEDAPIYGQQIERYLKNLKSAGLGNKRYIRKTGKRTSSYDHHFYNHTRHVHADD